MKKIMLGLVILVTTLTVLGCNLASTSKKSSGPTEIIFGMALVVV